MDFPYIDEIVLQLQDDSFSIFCGAGASADATKAKWIDIFTDTTKEFYSLKFSEDIYFLADLEKNYYNKENFYTNIERKLVSQGTARSAHIDAITDLSINQIWTTNFDTIIEDTIRRKFGFSPTIIKESKDLFVSSLNGPYTIYKLNGSTSDTTCVNM